MSPVRSSTSIYNPLVIGEHYVCYNGTPILVYKNVYDGKTTLVTRVIAPQFQKAVEILRKQYFANYRVGCIPADPTENNIKALPPITSLIIEGFPTIEDYVAKYGVLVVRDIFGGRQDFCDILFYWLQLDNKGQTSSSPIITTDTLGANDSIMASYIYINKSGFVKMNISIDMEFLEGDFFVHS